jgi:pyruvate dehydrogenase E2 component (dihydrolipoamide acetyltransferase)
MVTALTMPALSPTMEKGNLARWLVAAGDEIKTGDLLAEIETDKATMEYEAPSDGVIDTIIVSAGTEDVAVGTVIASIRALGAANDAVGLISTPTFRPVLSVQPTAGPNASSASMPAQASKFNGSYGVKASPLARRLADAQGLDLGAVKGSGPRGKVVMADVIQNAAAELAPSAGDRPVDRAFVVLPATPHDVVKLTAMRKTIARRLTDSKRETPHFYLGVDVRMDELMALRRQLNAALAARQMKLSVNDFMIKALALALDQTPDANVQFGDDELYRFKRVDVSFAVAVPGGLVTPVIVDAATKRLSQIAVEAQALAAGARDGNLLPEQYQGGTASISNLGGYGMRHVVPVLNPPQAMILGIGAAEQRAIGVDGEVVLASMITAMASFDHRAIDGAVAAQCLSAFKSIVESPLQFLA